jgi:hypothetical protein
MGLFSKLLQKRKERVEAGRACYAESPTASPARVVKERKERGDLDRALHARSSTTHAAPVDTKKKESTKVGRASYTGPSPAYAAKESRIERKRDSLFGEVNGVDEGKRWSVDVKEALEMKWNEVLAKPGANDPASKVVQDRRYRMKARRRGKQLIGTVLMRRISLRRSEVQGRRKDAKALFPLE